MNLLFTLLLLAGMEGWSVEAISDYELIIINNMAHSITCYIYYEDGGFLKRLVQAGSESRPFSRDGLEGVECY